MKKVTFEQRKANQIQNRISEQKKQALYALLAHLKTEESIFGRVK